MKVKNIMFSGIMAAILTSVAGNASAAISVASQGYVDTEIGKVNATVTNLETNITNNYVTNTNLAGAVADAIENAESGKLAEIDSVIDQVGNAQSGLVADVDSLQDAMGDNTIGDLGKDASGNAITSVQSALALKEDVANKKSTLSADEYEGMSTEEKQKYYTSVAAAETIANAIVTQIEADAGDLSQLRTDVNTAMNDIDALEGLVGTSSVQSQISTATEGMVTTANKATTLADYATDEEVKALVGNETVTNQISTALSSYTNTEGTKTLIATAKQEAIDAAEGDATTKANDALSSAKTYTNDEIAKLSALAKAEVPTVCTSDSTYCVLSYNGTEYSWMPLTAPADTPTDTPTGNEGEE